DGPAAAVALSAAPSQPGLLPPGGSTAGGGGGGDRTVTGAPAPGQSGTGVVTLTVTGPDGMTSARACAVTVTPAPPPPPPPPNTPPRVSDVSNVTVAAGAAGGPIAFTVGDDQTPADGLTVTAASDNPA